MEVSEQLKELRIEILAAPSGEAQYIILQTALDAAEQRGRAGVAVNTHHPNSSCPECDALVKQGRHDADCAFDMERLRIMDAAKAEGREEGRRRGDLHHHETDIVCPTCVTNISKAKAEGREEKRVEVEHAITAIYPNPDDVDLPTNLKAERAIMKHLILKLPCLQPPTPAIPNRVKDAIQEICGHPLGDTAPVMERLLLKHFPELASKKGDPSGSPNNTPNSPAASEGQEIAARPSLPPVPEWFAEFSRTWNGGMTSYQLWEAYLKHAPQPDADTLAEAALSAFGNPSSREIKIAATAAIKKALKKEP